MYNFLNADIDNEPKLRNSYPSLNELYLVGKKSRVKYWLYGILIGLVVILFVPWTQNIRADGKVTALRPQDRPQELNALIPGRIAKWYVKEGDRVSKGDTLLRLEEVKTEYLDPNLTTNTRLQVEAKQNAAAAYQDKAEASEKQVEALSKSQQLKLSSLNNKIQQQQLKIKSAEAEIVASQNALNAYSRQIDAAQTMLDSGVISLKEFEKRRVNYQDGIAKVTSNENKLDQLKQELLNLEIEKNATVQEYAEKIAKTRGEQYSSISSLRTTGAEVAKLQNSLANYVRRKDFLYLLAPQDGQITKAMKAGIGEVVKEGEMLVEIVPSVKEKAIELYIKPMDIPLISIGQRVQFIFDGFPAVVFSGWPSNSYGTFSGNVAAIESATNAEGKFRVLVVPDHSYKPWPDMLQIGGGARGIALLKDVPIYYELWRNINGFPPQYYKHATDEKKAAK